MSANLIAPARLNAVTRWMTPEQCAAFIRILVWEKINSRPIPIDFEALHDALKTDAADALEIARTLNDIGAVTLRFYKEFDELCISAAEIFDE